MSGLKSGVAKQITDKELEAISTLIVIVIP